MSCPVLAFFGQGILDLVMPRYCQWRGIRLSYRFGACTYDTGTSFA
jgi:hypothetical protein